MSQYFQTVAPVRSVENEGTVHERVRLDHDAFGEISVIRRSNSHEVAMYGSDLGHRTAIVVKLARSHQLRNFNTNVTSSDEELIEFEVSESQWARIVSSVGGGSTPVTLRKAPPRGAAVAGMPMIEGQSMRQQFHNEVEEKFAKYMRDGAELLNKFEQLAETKGAINKTEFKQMREAMSALVDGLPRNFAFMQEQFHNTMERTADQVKTELESYMAGVVRQRGAAAMIEDGTAVALPTFGKAEN
jgi:hypothetical protein